MFNFFEWIKRDTTTAIKRKNTKPLSWQQPIIITKRTPATEHLYVTARAAPHTR